MTNSPNAEGSRRLVRTLTITVFIQWMGASSIIPMLPVYIRHLGGSDALAGVVMASFFAAGVLSQYPIGRMADRVGRRPVLVAGLLTYAAASLAFLLPITAPVAILLRSLQGVGAGAAIVAALAIVSSSVPEARRGRAFAAIYGGELAGLAVGPLVGSIVGADRIWVMFLASAVMSFGACVPAMRIRETGDPAATRAPRRLADGSRVPLARLRVNRSMTGALICGAALGLTSGVYDICWTLLLLARGASGLAIGISWTLFAVPFVAVARPSGWLADHTDRRRLVLGGLGLSTVLCASYPFIHSVPLLIILGGFEALGYAAAMPALQSLLTQGAAADQVGRVQGVFATGQTACTAVAAAAAGAAFAMASWLPFLTVAAVVTASLLTAAVIWRRVPGTVSPAAPGRVDRNPDAPPTAGGSIGGATAPEQVVARPARLPRGLLGQAPDEPPMGGDEPIGVSADAP